MSRVNQSRLFGLPMLFTWFDHPLIEAWLERQDPATSRLTTSRDRSSRVRASGSHRRDELHP